MSEATRRHWLLGAAALAMPWRAAWSQGVRVPTVTLQVKRFFDLELRLLDAQRAGDAATLQSLLSEDFEMRVARRPGTPVPRAEWLAEIAQHKPAEMAIDQLAVHDHGPVADASFQLRPMGGARGAVPLFIVDTWTKEGDAWRLRVRYAAPVASAAQRVPGETDTPTIDKKY